MQGLEGKTERLWLRNWEERDRAAFRALNQDPVVMEHFPRPYTYAETDGHWELLKERIHRRGYGLMAVERIDTGQCIGFVGIQEPSYELPFGPCTEIGWRLAREHWGHGFATEAARACLRFAFEGRDLDEIVSFTAVPNQRSIAVMERLGMHRDPETFAHPKVPADSPLREHVLYRLRADDWRRTQA